MLMLHSLQKNVPCIFCLRNTYYMCYIYIREFVIVADVAEMMIALALALSLLNLTLYHQLMILKKVSSVHLNRWKSSTVLMLFVLIQESFSS